MTRLPIESRNVHGFEKWVAEPNTGCWLWLGYCKPNGYGQIHRNEHAHRVAYIEAKGPIPAGFTIDHLCRTRCCVNPSHLEAVPQRENLRRGDGWSGRHARQTHCIHGHELSGRNLIIRPRAGGGRECRECKRQRERNKRDKAAA